MLLSELRGIYYIALKDMKTYYLKPPAVSWGIIFPLTWIFAFYPRSPQRFEELVPGLVALTILFSTTAAEAVVINFEIRFGTFERLLLAPISLSSVLLGKVLGGVIFGLLMTTVIVIISSLVLKMPVNLGMLILVILPSLVAFTALGSLTCLCVKEVMDAQIVLNIPRFMMLFLSGVVYPIHQMPEFLQIFAYFLPLTYTVEGIHQAYSQIWSLHVWLDSLALTIFSILFVFPAIWLLARRFQ